MLRSAVLLVLGLALVPATFASQARADEASAFIAKWDTNHDGTLDLTEINKAADAKFEALDADHDGTLTKKELGRRVTKAEFQAADKDHEGTLDKPEFEAIVAGRVKAANPDNDTTIDAAELRTAAGHRVLQLLH